jgi:hypothetical protein
MDGPWYECIGPSAEDARKAILERLGEDYNEVVTKVVPDNRNDFGSWRGFFCFKINDLVKECRALKK